MLSLLSQYLSSLSPVTLIFLYTALIWLLFQVWKGYHQLVRMTQHIEQIPGPRVTSWMLGHLSLLWNGNGNSDSWYQQMFNTFIGMTKLYQQQSTGFLRLWIGPLQPLVVIYEAESAEGILTSTVNINKSREYEFAVPWLGLGLITSNGDKWRMHRKMLTPAFHYKILEKFTPIIQKQQQVMMETIKKVIDSNGVIPDIRPIITNCSLDIICETAMGVNISAQTNPNSQYLKSVHRMLELFILRFLSPWMWNDYLFQITPTGIEQRKNIKYLHDFTKSVINQKRDEIMDNLKNGNSDAKLEAKGKTKSVMAFLDSLLTLNIKKPNSLSDEDIRAEVDTFMGAGHDTSSVTIQFALQLIGNYPKVQAKIHEELDEIFGDDHTREIRFEDLPQMKYLEKCVKEALRLFPPVLFTGRLIKEDFKIKDKTIPAGTTCLVLFYQMHRDPKYFPNPELFDPERFSPENCEGRHPLAYTPFSAGPRNCIGQKFAMQTLKSVIGSILRQYKITSLLPMDKVELEIGTVMSPKNKIPLRMEARF